MSGALNFPDPPVTTGQTYTSPNGATSWLYDGTKWLVTGGNALAVGDSPPANPANGQLWWDSIGLALMLYYNDGNSSQWVPATPQGTLADAPQDANAYLRQNAQWVTGVTSAQSGYNVGRNALHNPYFNIQQRGTSFTTPGFTADRWSIGWSGGSGSMSLTAMTDADRAAIGDEAALYKVVDTFTGTGAAGDYHQIIQQIENLHRLSGKTITTSFWAMCSATPLSVGVGNLLLFGTGGSPSAMIRPTGTPVALTTTWRRYSVTATLPSTAGMTYGTNNDSYLQVAFWLSSGSTYANNAGNIGVQSGTVSLWGAQCEVGTVMTPLEKIDPMLDLQRCQRFFQTGKYVVCFSNSSAGGTVGNTWCLPVQMRAAPTTAVIGTPAYSNCSGARMADNDVTGFTCVVAVTATGGGYGVFNWTASADL
jgi:hypothetical protein